MDQSDRDLLHHISEKVDNIAKQQSELNAVIVGVGGVGGLHRWVSDIQKRLDTTIEVKIDGLNSKIEELNAFKWKVLGLATGASLFASVFGSKLAALFGGK